VYQTTPWPAVRPSSASSTILPFFQLASASVSGAFEVLPSSFMRLNAGVSFRLSRIHTETMSSRNDSRNGTRQPQSLNAASPRNSLQARMTISERNRPSVAVVWIHEVYAPRLPCGACSAT
jgi:hypothetical protein